MSLSAAALDALLAAGASAEQIVAVVKAEITAAKGSAEERRRQRLQTSESEWLRLCGEVYRRDGEVCRYCGATERLSIDHIHPRARGGTNDLNNLCVACIPCNSSKCDRPLSEWRGRLM